MFSHHNHQLLFDLIKRGVPLLLVIGIVALGIRMTLFSHADNTNTSYGSAYASNGTNGGDATFVVDSTAGDGYALQFGAPAPVTLLPPSVPTGSSIYLGAQVNPTAASNALQPSSCYDSADSVATLECDMGRHLALLHSYIAFSDSNSPPIATIKANAANGTVTIVDWDCKDFATDTPAQLAADTAYVKSWADQLKAYGGPVFLRWCWEMNLPSHTISPADYVTTWKDIYTIFKGSGGEGANNVSFIWCQSVDAANASYPFYPGDQYVDWIGTDGYDRSQNGVKAFAGIFGSWYSYWTQKETNTDGSVITDGSKPLMIGETGGIAPIPTENEGSYGLQTGSDQGAYLRGLQADLDPNASGNNGTSQYPAIKAVVYFDAAGAYGDWSLTNGTVSVGGAAVNGLDVFDTMSNDSYFGYTNTNK